MFPVIHSPYSNVDVNLVVTTAYAIFVGVIVGMLGSGGGTLIVPFLTLYMNVPMKTALGTSLFQVSGIAAAGAYQHRKLGSADLKLALILLISGPTMAYVGAHFTQHLPSDTLKSIFGVFVIIIAFKMIQSGRPTQSQTAKTSRFFSIFRNLSISNFKFRPVAQTATATSVSSGGGGFAFPLKKYIPKEIKRTNTAVGDYTINVPKTLALGALVGFVCGVLGVGGGFLLVPGLVFLSIPMKVAVGTDLAQMVVTSSVGAATYFSMGEVDLIIGTILMIGGIIGTAIGTRLNKRFKPRTLKIIFGFLMIPIGLSMIIKGMHIHLLG